MIRAVLIDDEPKNNHILKNMLEQFCLEVAVIGQADDSSTGIKIIQQEIPDLVFLDIEMPYGNAFDLLDNFKPVNFEVIFVTAFSNYMLKAFKYSAVDYLMKPVDIRELKMAVERVIERRKKKQVNLEQLDFLLERLKNQKLPLDKLALPTKDGLVFRNVADILRCEAHRGYTIFHMNTGEKFIVARNIKDLEDMLPESSFFRIHNTHLININFIKKYHKGRGGHVEMSDGTMLEVATRRKDQLLARFGYGN